MSLSFCCILDPTEGCSEWYENSGMDGAGTSQDWTKAGPSACITRRPFTRVLSKVATTLSQDPAGNNKLYSLETLTWRGGVTARSHPGIEPLAISTMLRARGLLGMQQMHGCGVWMFYGMLNEMGKFKIVSVSDVALFINKNPSWLELERDWISSLASLLFLPSSYPLSLILRHDSFLLPGFPPSFSSWP